jgi:hypothetical protein
MSDHPSVLINQYYYFQSYFLIFNTWVHVTFYYYNSEIYYCTLQLYSLRRDKASNFSRPYLFLYHNFYPFEAKLMSVYKETYNSEHNRNLCKHPLSNLGHIKQFFKKQSKIEKKNAVFLNLVPCRSCVNRCSSETPLPVVGKQTIPTERPSLFGEVSSNKQNQYFPFRFFSNISLKNFKTSIERIF